MASVWPYFFIITDNITAGEVQQEKEEKAQGMWIIQLFESSKRPRSLEPNKKTRKRK